MEMRFAKVAGLLSTEGRDKRNEKIDGTRVRYGGCLQVDVDVDVNVNIELEPEQL